MEARPAYFRSAIHLLRRRYGAARPARCRAEKTRRPVRSQKIQRPGNLVRQSAGEIRAGIDGALGGTRCPQRVDIVLRLSTKFLTLSSEKPIHLWYHLLTRRFLPSLRFRGAAADDFF